MNLKVVLRTLAVTGVLVVICTAASAGGPGPPDPKVGQHTYEFPMPEFPLVPVGSRTPSYCCVEGHFIWPQNGGQSTCSAAGMCVASGAICSGNLCLQWLNGVCQSATEDKKCALSVNNGVQPPQVSCTADTCYYWTYSTLPDGTVIWHHANGVFCNTAATGVNCAAVPAVQCQGDPC